MLCRIKSSRISASDSSAVAAMPQQSVRRRVENLSAARTMQSTMRLSESTIFDAIPIPLAAVVLDSLLLKNQRRSSHGSQAGIGARHASHVALVGGGRLGCRGLSRDRLRATFACH